MKKKFQGWRKKVAVGLLAAALCGSLSAQDGNGNHAL